MNALDVVKQGLRYAGPVVHALQAIQAITGLGDNNAAAALRAIDDVVRTTLDGIAKGLDPAEIVKELDKLASDIAANDMAADAALADKFRK